MAGVALAIVESLQLEVGGDKLVVTVIFGRRDVLVVGQRRVFGLQLESGPLPLEFFSGSRYHRTHEIVSLPTLARLLEHLEALQALGEKVTWEGHKGCLSHSLYRQPRGYLENVCSSRLPRRYESVWR